MRILITGVCGFVGSALACGLREGWPDWEIAGIDNLIRPGSETNRLALKQRGVKLVHGDIRCPSDLEALPRCDWILDAAANPSVLAGVDGRTGTRQVLEHNLVGTVNLLELAKNWRAGFLMMSTSRVYSLPALIGIEMQTRGDRLEPDVKASGAGWTAGGITEDFSTEPPLSIYGTSKRASELLVCEYAAAFGLPAWINRCGVLAGAGQFGTAEQGIFSYWIHAWRAKRRLKYIGFGGAGRQVRDCLHVRDLLLLAGQQLKASGGSQPRILNVSGGIEGSASLRQLSAWCEQRFGPGQVEAELQGRPFDVPWLILDSAQAKTVWGWKPQTSLLATWEEIAEHAERNPDWLQMTT